ncbi:DUF488 domain-containing protein [Lactobacillus psittaci]|nr:DUF488 family protein [Lactobacillus psittaci]
MSEIKLVRIYSKDQPDGYRILVDRIWPRGMSKEKAQLDLWAKTIAPSSELRKWYHHEVEKFPEFKAKYQAELTQNPDLAAFKQLIKTKLTKQDVLFLFGARDELHNQAQVLREFLKDL